MHQPADAHSPIPIRRQLTELREHVSEGGSDSRTQVLPSPRELVGLPRYHSQHARARHRGSQAEWVPPLLPLTAAAPSSILGCLRTQGRHAGDPVW